MKLSEQILATTKTIPLSTTKSTKTKVVRKEVKPKKEVQTVGQAPNSLEDSFLTGLL